MLRVLEMLGKLQEVPQRLEQLHREKKVDKMAERLGRRKIRKRFELFERLERLDKEARTGWLERLERLDKD